MLKWTLRAPGDTCSCPPSPPLKSGTRSQADPKVDLEDSNKCWYETRVKIAEVKSTSKVVQFNSKENVRYEYIENNEGEITRDNNSIFQKLLPFSSMNDDIEKRKKSHKHIKCNALDPLKIFTGDITDSDTGSVYMKLDKTPAALVPKEMPSTGPFDPRRRPLIDISNGDYSDLRKHLQLHNIPFTTLLQPPPPYHEGAQDGVLQQPNREEGLTFYEQLRNFKNRVEMSSSASGRINDPGKISSSEQRGRSDCASSRHRSSSVPRTRHLKTLSSNLTNSTLTTTSVTTTTSCTSATSVCSSSGFSSRGASQMSSGCLLEGSSHRNFRGRRRKEEDEFKKQKDSTKFLLSRKRHSIADIPCVNQRVGDNQSTNFRDEDVFSIYGRPSVNAKEVPQRASINAKDVPLDSGLREEKKGSANENQKKSSGKRLGIYHKIFDTKVGGRKKVKKEEAIYESIKAPSSTYSAPYSVSSRATDGGMAIYVSMKDLRTAENNGISETAAKDDDYEICGFSSSPSKGSPARKRGPIQLSDFHIYENAALSLPTDSSLNASLPESFIHYDLEKDDTCDFTSEPQRNVHKPVAIKGSNDLISRFGKSPTDRQHPLPQYGLHISADPVKKPCKWRYIHKEGNSERLSNIPCFETENRCNNIEENVKNFNLHQSSFDSQRYYENLDFVQNSQMENNLTLLNKSKSESCIYKPSHLHTSTGQHLHTTTSAINLPGLPLYHLRPPPPAVPHSLKNGQSHFINKMKKKSKSVLKLDGNLPIIYEVHNQEEEIYAMRKIEKDKTEENDHNRSLNNKESMAERDDLNLSGSSPDCHSNKSQSSDNLDSGLSEGINTPLVSPMSGPPSPNSDSLLGEPQGPLSLEDLKIYKENEHYTKENESFSCNYMGDIFKYDLVNNFLETGDMIRNNKQFNEEKTNDSFGVFDFYGKHSTPIKYDYSKRDSLSGEAGTSIRDMSKLLQDAVEKNLFHDSLPQRNSSPVNNLSNSFKSSHLCNITRRHSFASIKDISLSKIDPNRTDCSNETSVWSPNSPSPRGRSTPTRVLKKSHSFMSLSPAVKTSFVPWDKGVTEDGGTVTKDGWSLEEEEEERRRRWEQTSDVARGGKGSSRETSERRGVRPTKEPGRAESGQGYFGKEASPPFPMGRERKGRSDCLFLPRERDEERHQKVELGRLTATRTSNSPLERHVTAEVSGAVGADADERLLHPSQRHLFSVPPHRTSPSDLPSCLLSSFAGNPTLPGEKEEEMNPQQHVASHSVPQLQPLSKDAVKALETLPSSISNYGPEQENSDDDKFLTEKQRLRQAESLFRLQRLLDQAPSDGEEESSADWSLEAVIDESSQNGLDSPYQQSPPSSGSGAESPDCQDNFSICTLDSDLADSVYIGPKLCDKIRQVSEDKMFAKLRRSFRKKEKCVLPKVGIFMFVDNPMYVSPEAKKEAKIVTFTPSKRKKSFRFKDKSSDKTIKPDKLLEEEKCSKKSVSWYVGNPIYNSPVDYIKRRQKSSLSLQHTTQCEKENIKNYQVSKSVSNTHPRVPLGDLWIQTNPCYESPEVKVSGRIIQSPSKRKIDSPKRSKYKKPLPALPSTTNRKNGACNESHYLTPIVAKKPVPIAPHDKDILDLQKYIDHEYCTIPGDEESDSWVSQSSLSKKSEGGSPSAKRNLDFESDKRGCQGENRKGGASAKDILTCKVSKIKASLDGPRTKSANTPSRIWRQESLSSLQSTPKGHYKGTLEKSLECQMPFGDRGYKTPRSVKREKMNKNISKRRPPPDLPPNPAPLPPAVAGCHLFEDTSAFHHARLVEGISPTGETSFQLAPDSIYESLSFIHGDRAQGMTSPRRDLTSLKSSGGGTTSGICSSCSSNNSSTCSCNSLGSPLKGGSNRNSFRRRNEAKEQVPTQGSSAGSVVASSSSGISSSYSRSTSKSVIVRKRKTKDSRLNSSRGVGRRSSNINLSSLSLGGANVSIRGARGRKTPRKMVSKKYKAREVLQGKGQLRLSVYENCGLLTIHIVEARKLRSQISSICNPYVKISLVPDNLERTFCRTTLLRATNTPFFDQKFSFDFLPEDLDKRLLISLWSRDTLRKRSEFLGCMSFSVAHILSKRVSGWFRLLTEAVGRRKHFAVSFFTGSVDNNRYEERESLQPVSLPTKTLIPKYPASSRMTSSSAGNSPPSGQTPYTISINIQRTNDGFGFSVAWTRPPRVERVEPGKAADLAGLRAGDYIIFVGHQNVVKLDENSVLKVIRECGEELCLEVYRRGVSRTPKTLLNGWARPPPMSGSDPTSSSSSCEALKKNKIGQATLGNENHASILQEKFLSLVTCEQRFCYNFQFGLERFLIPLKFRVDLLTPSNHSKLFSSFEQILDLTDALVEHLIDTASEFGAYNLGSIYECVIESLVEDYTHYFRCLPKAEKILSALLKDPDFIEFLKHPIIPRRKPDITSFVHLPAEHLRDVIELLEEILAFYPDKLHYNFLSLRDVKEKFMAVYRNATIEQNIMEPSILCSSPVRVPASGQNRNFSPGRRPLISTKDIERRLVFTKYIKPFKLSDGNRQWLFGSELSKFEGKHLKQYWVMLFSDLLLLTAVNRDRVIFVMEEPLLLESIIDTIFCVKKKATEFRLVVDTNMEFPSEYFVGKGSTGYLTRSGESGTNSKNSTLSRGRLSKVRTQRRQTIVFRAPNIELKSTWENLLGRQIYLCHSAFHDEAQNKVHGIFTPSLLRATSQEGVLQDSSELPIKNRSESCDDLRPSVSTLEQKLDEEAEKKYYLRLEGEVLESNILPSCAKADSEGNFAPNPVTPPKANHVLPAITVDNYDPSNASHSEGKEEEEQLEGEQDFSILTENPKESKEENEKHEDDLEDLEEGQEDDEELSLERARLRPRKASKSKGNKKFFGGKFKNKLLLNRNQPPKKVVNRAKKVENYVDSLSTEGIDNRRSVTPLFEHEESLKTEDFIAKREEMLTKKINKGFEFHAECEELIILADELPVSTSSQNQGKVSSPHLSPQLSGVRLEKLPSPEIKSPLILEGIAMESAFKGSTKDVPITPEGYEEYLDGEIEEDYPELKSTSGSVKSEEKLYTEEQPLANDDLNVVEFEQTTTLPSQSKVEAEVHEETNMNLEITCHPAISCDNQRLSESPDQREKTTDDEMMLEPTRETEPKNKACDPLSGSSSMSFMDETTPTSVDSNYDFYQRTTRAAFKAESMCNQCITERNKVCDLSDAVCELSLDSSNSSLNNYVEGANSSPFKSSQRHLISNRRKDSSASMDNDTMTFSNNSSNSSMSTSSNSVASEHSTIKPRSMLFIPTNISSLPEISLEPPTPLTPKPKDNNDVEKNVVYDLKVPGYKSMFLTVPGLDDYEDDRYLPGTTYDPKSENSSCSTSSSDDDLVHKPRVFASLLGIAEKRGLKSYGSTQDLSKFGLSSPEDDLGGGGDVSNGNEVDDDELNGNLSVSNHVLPPPFQTKLSKIGGTKSGKFVASKLAMFEQVAEEERRKYLECQEARMRIAGKTFKHSGEYITKFYQPQNPDVLRVQENELLTVDKMRDNNNTYPDYYRPPSPYVYRRDSNSFSYCQEPTDTDFLIDREEQPRLTFKRQSTTESTSSWKRKEDEVMDLLDKSYQECLSPDLYEDLSEVNSDIPETFNKGTIKSSLKRSPSIKDRDYHEISSTRRVSLTLPPSPISHTSSLIRRGQQQLQQSSIESEEDDMLSPSRVRFSPVTDIFTRKTSFSSEEDDYQRGGTEENGGVGGLELEDRKLKGELVVEDKDDDDGEEEKCGFLESKSSPKVCPKGDKVKSFASHNEEILASKGGGKTEKSSKKRFVLFRGQKKEDSESTTFVVKALKGKRLIFQKNKRKKKNSQDNQVRSSSKESISEEEIL